MDTSRHLLHDDWSMQSGSNAAHKIKGLLLLLLLLLLDGEHSARQTNHFRFVGRDAHAVSAPDNCNDISFRAVKCNNVSSGKVWDQHMNFISCAYIYVYACL